MSDTKTFFEAIRTGDVARVKSLLDTDSSLGNSKDESGASAILFSIYAGQREVRELLLASGAKMDLPEAAAAGELETVKRLVEPDSSLAKSFSPDGFPLFALACFFGHLGTARFLAEKGADIHVAASNGTGYNALTASVTAGHTEIVKWLLERGMDPNYRYSPGFTPLLSAAANGHLEIVKLLLSHGADLQATANDGKSALAFAMERNHGDIADFLRARSASGS
jgi:uncharacterized protein